MPRRRGAALVLGVALGLLALLWWRSETMQTLGSASAPASPIAPQTQLYSGRAAAEFPIYAPQYPGSSVEDAQHFVTPQGSVMMVRMRTRDTADVVAGFYRRVLADKAFRPTQRTERGKQTVAGARASAGLSVLIEAAPGDDGTIVSLTVNEYADRPGEPARRSRP